MISEQYNSRTADKFVVRLPDGLREKVEAAAKARYTSMNTLMVQRSTSFCTKMSEWSYCLMR